MKHKFKVGDVAVILNREDLCVDEMHVGSLVRIVGGTTSSGLASIRLLNKASPYSQGIYAVHIAHLANAKGVLQIKSVPHLLETIRQLRGTQHG